MSLHRLKTIQPHFTLVSQGFKTFEIRKHDRDYKVNDKLVLDEWNEEKQVFTGAGCMRTIRHILTYKDYPQGIKEGYCILSIK